MSRPASAPSSSGRPYRVLIVRTGAMGDVLHAMPAVTAMRERHPEWEIGWAIEPRWLPLLRSADGQTMPLVDRVHEVPTGAWNRRPVSLETLREIRHLRGELRAELYDLCVDMQGLLRSAVVGRFARAATFAGSARPRESVARWWYTQRIETAAAHVIDRGCELLGGALGERLTATAVHLPCDEVTARWCEETLDQLVPEGGAFAVLAPTAGWGAKQWPVERYGAVAAALYEAGCTPLINAAKEHDPVAAAVAKASGGLAQPVVCSMAELIALLRRADVVIAGDTGPLHMAAALSRPVVGLYGPTDPARTGPYGTRSEVIRHASSSVDHRRHSEPEYGLSQITVDEVVAATLRVVRCQGGV